ALATGGSRAYLLDERGSPASDDPMITERCRVPTNGIELDVGIMGPAKGPPVVLLHGFPETGRCWRHQAPMLASSGFRVIVPEQRGYGRSDKPAGRAAYDIDVLVADIVGLLDALGHSEAAWVGHDWGGAVTWWAAQHEPAHVRRFAVLNCPHPTVLARHLLTNPSQMRRSLYMAFFQLPVLPERTLRKDDFRALEQAIQRSSAPGAYPPEELAAYKEAWREPGCVEGMLAWYRAARCFLWRWDTAPIGPPGLLLWGKRDHALGPELAEPSVALCRTGHLTWIEEAGHFVQNDAPERVNVLLSDFL
ncbi:MAG: alpha/beta fold hydrolase, partial [Myxococcota bacterium]